MSNSYNTVTVTSTATQILAADTWRSGLTLYNNGSVTVYVGTDANVTTATGMPLAASGAYDFNGWFSYRGPLYGITASSSADVRYIAWTK